MSQSLRDLIAQIEKSRGIDAVRAFLLSDVSVFVAYFAGYNIKDFQDITMKAVLEVQHLEVLFPEAHGKSTLISCWEVIFEIARNPNIRILLAMKTDKMAADWLVTIEEILETNEELIRLFGPFKKRGAKWNSQEMNVAKRQIISSNPTVRAIGAKPSSVGTGCDWLIIDDLVHVENAKTEYARKALDQWVRTTADSMPRKMWDNDLVSGWMKVPLHAPNGDLFLWPRVPVDDIVEEYRRRGYYSLDQVPADVTEEVKAGKPIEYERRTLIGTLYHIDDPLSTRAGRVEGLPQGVLIDDAYRREYGIDPAPSPGWTLLYFDCWVDEACTIPRWPEHRDAAWLARELHIRDSVEFNKRLRNIVIDELNAIFKMAFVRGGVYNDVPYPGMYDDKLTCGAYNEGDLIVVVCDPSSGRETRISSWTSYLVLAADPKQLESSGDPQVNVIDGFRFRAGFDDILDVMMSEDDSPQTPSYWARYRYNIGIIEVNDKQLYFTNCRRTEDWNLAHNHRIRGWETNTNKLDKHTGVQSLDGPIRNGLIKVANATPTDKETMRLLISQLLAYPEGTADFVMALWIGYQTLRDGMERGEAYYEEGYVPGSFIVNPAHEGEVVPTQPPGRKPTPKKVLRAKRYSPIVIARKGR
jgi:hypothetical protein